MKPLTEKQAAVKVWADRGYSAPEIARVLNLRSVSLVYDMTGAIRRKGYRVQLAGGHDRTLNPAEARRIAADARIGKSSCCG